MNVSPADGWYDFRKGGKTREFAKMTSELEAANILANDGVLSLFLPVKKGTVSALNYSLSGQTYAFRFIYAIGSEPSA